MRTWSRGQSHTRARGQLRERRTQRNGVCGVRSHMQCVGRRGVGARIRRHASWCGSETMRLGERGSETARDATFEGHTQG